MAECKEPTCSRPVKTRGYCDTHYKFHRRHGRLGGTPCKFDGCKKISVAVGWCANHYMKVRKHGDPNGRREWGKATKHPLRGTWMKMKRRCNAPADPAYSSYGGRGIKMCERWDKDFWAFVDDMGPRPTPQHTIDRIDNDGGYTPENCRWATKAEQSRNRGRFVVLDERLIAEARRRHEFGDQIAHIALSLHVPYPTLWQCLSGNTWCDTEPRR